MTALRVCVFVSCLCLVSSQVVSRDVVIDQGTVRGYNDDDASVFSYYGIPYASTPRGEDKFKGPLPPPSWTGILEATARTINCPHRPSLSDPFMTLNRTMDCLIVNVFVPDTNETNLPVLVYVHGGGFQEGYGMVLSPLELATKGVITVTLNYRLGIHGFLCLGTEVAPGNAGLKDQSAALRWVKENIARFGGDSDNILLGGGSAGSISVELQMLSPLSNGSFHKLALESASAVSSVAVDLTPLDVAQSFANRYGVSGGLQELDAFYRTVGDDVLYESYQIPGYELDMGFTVCVETHNLEGVDTFLSALPVDIMRSGNYEKRPVLSGYTSMEGLEFANAFDIVQPAMENNFVQFVPVDLHFESELEAEEATQKIFDFYFPTGEVTYEGAINVYTDTGFAYPHLLSARLHTKNSIPVYLYLWSFNGTLNLPGLEESPIWGPGHIAQSLYLLDFDNTRVYENMNSDDYLLRERIQEIYLNFMRYGVPIPSRTELLDAEWLPLTEETDNYLDIDLQLTLKQSPLQERMDFWDQMYARSAADSASRSGVLKSLAIITILILALF